MHHFGGGHLLLPRGEHRRGGGHEVEKRLSQAVGRMRRELGFHSVQSDRRQLLYGLLHKSPSSTNQSARCSCRQSDTPFFDPFLSRPAAILARQINFVRAKRNRNRLRSVNELR